ncbi:DUF429 domain-containing protein [Hoyosella altamirensis]|uniref:Putative RNase H-like nuclease n=1 Tax=Hoyosella altamirensis TaxID=616997 RepID=A0A839RLG2_9ACTN|nr:DUF429 domain-containing protein [Hoyosella altamirensis]MBB3036936.1 putative RNase H-like nuclease [Hoyosella altamirensis]
MTRVRGIDGYARGWIGVELDDGALVRVESAPTLAALCDPGCAVIGVDIPLGFPEKGWRAADLAARRALGVRRNSIFLAPPISVWEEDNWIAANKRTRQLTGQGLTKQAYALRIKVLEANALSGTIEQPLREVHPELSFAGMNGSPLPYSKKTWNGVMARRALLAACGIAVPDDLGAAGTVPVDDVLDAAAAAWSAHRIAVGAATALPEQPELSSDGRPMAIWF